MTKNLSELHKRITTISEELPNFDTDERKEIKKNNKLIDNYVEELTLVKDVLFDEMKKRYPSLIPNNEPELNDLSLKKAQEMLKYLSQNSYLSKMELDRNLYEIKYSNSLDIINKNILELLNKLSQIGILLSNEDFKYSLPLYKYMKNFFQLKTQENFTLQIKDTFESLYWECPSLVNHIYLSFIYLLEKYQEKFEIYIKNQTKSSTNYEEALSNYYQISTAYQEQLSTNETLVYQKFQSNELRIEDYLDNSILKKETISKFINYEEYLNQSEETRNHFYEQITNIYYDLCESVWLNKYAYLIKKTKEIYTNKGNYQNDYRNFQKTIKTLNKQRLSINTKLFTVYQKYELKHNERLLKKYNNLFNKANNKIEELITNYNKYDEILFVNDIITKLDDDSTYYDVFKVFENNYSYLLNLMKTESGDYQDYTSFLYNPNLNISKSLPFINEVNIEEKLIEKYDLYDLEINLTDKDKLIADLEYLIRLNNYEKHQLNLNNYKLIFDIKKLIGE